MHNITYTYNALTGDWICSDEKCGNVNSSQRTHCNRCNRVRPKSTMKMNPKQVLFKSNDWKCDDCGNINWAKRDKCNMCSKAKFSKKVNDGKLNKELRTGKGGGHYDIQGSNEKRVHDSDDEEYDEFGRKKKRKILDKDEKNDKNENESNRNNSNHSNSREEPSYKSDTYRNRNFNHSSSRNFTSNNYEKGNIYGENRNYSRPHKVGGEYHKNYYGRGNLDQSFNTSRNNGIYRYEGSSRYQGRTRHDDNNKIYDRNRRYNGNNRYWNGGRYENKDRYDGRSRNDVNNSRYEDRSRHGDSSRYGQEQDYDRRYSDRTDISYEKNNERKTDYEIRRYRKD
ncbi:hypothetical protein, conserved [Plasmodium gonderi]|uniref:Zinc finger Ran-binding domain-containing protein 2 n=1 Tax=Plasmodium gonderi TaxID=77519 RepID=A0A1Y1JEV0_PLAGO|nr:hypothetical protein, conserved [Plasmodium gonderi]GAW79262.1 hypothetical protein, conserved [Plasmodium gonderi]